MFDTLRTSNITICDIDVVAYLMMHGAKLEGVTVHAKNRAAFTLTGKNIPNLLHDFKQCKIIKFSPKAYMDIRRDLKHLSPDPAHVPEINQ